MIAAGIAALVLVSVLLAFHGWPTNAATGAVPRLIAATTSTSGPVPTLVIGHGQPTPRVAARGHARARQAPVSRSHNAPSSAPLYSDASRPKTQVTPPPAPPRPHDTCTGACPPPLPSPIDQIVKKGTDNANSLGQQLNDGITHASQTVGGVVNDVTKALGKTLGH